MRLIRLKTAIQGINYGYAPKDVVNWPCDAEAGRLVAGEQAEDAPENYSGEIKTHVALHLEQPKKDGKSGKKATAEKVPGAGELVGPTDPAAPATKTEEPATKPEEKKPEPKKPEENKKPEKKPKAPKSPK